MQDCYIHDLPGAGIHLAGGNMYNLIQRNYIANVGFGINVGFSTGMLLISSLKLFNLKFKILY